MVCAPLMAVERLQNLQERFDKETHAGNMVKMLDKLGAAQFAAASSAAKAEDYTTVGLTFEKFRDNVRSCLDLLTNRGPMRRSTAMPTGVWSFRPGERCGRLTKC